MWSSLLNSKCRQKMLSSSILVSASRVGLQAGVASFSTHSLPTGKHKLPNGYNSPSAFSIYVKENAKNGQRANELIKQVAKTWHELDESGKQQYRQKAEQIGAERKSAFLGLSEMERFNLRESQIIQKTQQLLRARRKVIHERNEKFGRPTKPANAYALYIGDYFRNNSGTIENRKESFKKAASSWKNLPANEKMKYESEAKKKTLEYQTELEKWRKENGTLDTDEKSQALLKGAKKLQV